MSNIYFLKIMLDCGLCSQINWPMQQGRDRKKLPLVWLNDSNRRRACQINIFKKTFFLAKFFAWVCFPNRKLMETSENSDVVLASANFLICFVNFISGKNLKASRLSFCITAEWWSYSVKNNSWGYQAVFRKLVIWNKGQITLSPTFNWLWMLSKCSALSECNSSVFSQIPFDTVLCSECHQNNIASAITNLVSGIKKVKVMCSMCLSRLLL